MKNSIKLFLLCVLIASSGFAQKTKPVLDNKKYDVLFYEIKATGRGKALKDQVRIKGGKIESDLMKEKIKLEGAIFKVTLDSAYTEDGSDMRMVTLEANKSEDKDEFKWEVTVTNYDIEGTVVQKKNGVEKKKFEFSGSEKTKK